MICLNHGAKTKIKLESILCLCDMEMLTHVSECTDAKAHRHLWHTGSKVHSHLPWEENSLKTNSILIQNKSRVMSYEVDKV